MTRSAHLPGPMAGQGFAPVHRRRRPLRRFRQVARAGGGVLFLVAGLVALASPADATGRSRPLGLAVAAGAVLAGCLLAAGRAPRALGVTLAGHVLTAPVLGASHLVAVIGHTMTAAGQLGRAALLAAMALTGTVPDSTPAGAGVTPADPASIRAGVDDALRHYVARHPLVPGAAVSMTVGAFHHASAAGRRATAGALLSPLSTFRTASTTKNFTAAAVLRLVEEGRLGLDQRVAEHLPDARRLPSGDHLTVRQLLNHTSGLGDYGTDPRWLARVVTQAAKNWTPEELLAAGSRTTAGTPGQRFHYSDTGYVLLGQLVERLTGSPLAAAYRQLLPFGILPSTYLEGREPERGGRRAHQHTGPLDLSGHDPSFDNCGGGGLVSTVVDLDAFVSALFGGRVFRDQKTLATMLETVPSAPGEAYGLGIGRRRIAGAEVWLHTGAFGSALAWVPSLDLSIGVTTNQTLATPDRLIADLIAIAGDPARPGS